MQGLNWQDALVGVCGLLYVGSALAFLLQGKPLWAGVYLSYAAANVFLILLARSSL